MKKYNKILEAINRGVQLALDDYDAGGDIQSKKISNYKEKSIMADALKLTVDLELPSGKLWSRYNLDVDPKEVKKREEERYGWYHAWGEMYTKPWTYTCNWYDYKLCDGSKDKLKKYCKEDGLKVLQPEDDIVQERTNGLFKIPSKADFQELFDNTTHSWENAFGLYGMWFWSKINEKGIFFPASGRYSRGHLDFKHICYYWTSDISEEDYSQAYIAKFTANSIQIRQHDRYDGLTIRPILNM